MNLTERVVVVTGLRHRGGARRPPVVARVLRHYLHDDVEVVDVLLYGRSVRVPVSQISIHKVV